VRQGTLSRLRTAGDALSRDDRLFGRRYFFPFGTGSPLCLVPPFKEVFVRWANPSFFALFFVGGEDPLGCALLPFFWMLITSYAFFRIEVGEA